MESTKNEIWIGNFIREASLEELVQMTITYKIGEILYIKKRNKKMLLNFLMSTTKRILDDGTHLIKKAVTEVLFTEVDSYKRVVVYDPFRKICSYLEDVEEVKRYQDTHLIPVYRYPNEIAERAAEKIIETFLSKREK